MKREEVVISTKASVCTLDGERHQVQEVVESLDQSLENLSIDCIDVFHLHGVPPDQYAYACEMVVPALLRERDKGKFSHLSESRRFRRTIPTTRCFFEPNQPVVRSSR